MSDAEDGRPENDESAEPAERDADEDSLMDASELGIELDKAAGDAERGEGAEHAEEAERAEGAEHVEEAEDAEEAERAEPDVEPDAAEREPEKVAESTLVELLQDRGKLPANEALGIVKQLAKELEATWDEEDVRADMRAGNILVNENGEVRIAELEEGAGAPAPADDQICAEYNYVSPEKLKDKAVDGRADVYALGVLLFRMITGEFPFTGDDGDAIAAARLAGRPRRASEVNPEVPDALADIIDAMLAADLAFRYPNPTEVLHDIRLIVEGPEVESQVGTAIMEKPDMAKLASEDETPANGTPAAEPLEVGGPKEAGAPSDAPTGPDAQEKAEPPDDKGEAGGKGLKIEVRFPAPHARGGTVGSQRVREKLRTLVAIVPLAAAGVVVVLVVGILVWSRAAPSDTETDASPAAVERQAVVSGDDLESEAGTRYRQLLKTYAAGQYKRVVGEIDSLGDKYIETTRVAELKVLRQMAAAKQGALEAAAADFYEARREEYEAGGYKLVLTGIEGAGERYAATTYVGKIASLADDARRKLGETVRREEAEAEREKRYWELVLRARDEIAGGEYGAALESLKQAKELKDSEEVDELTRKATRMRCVAQGRATEKAGSLKQAVDLYRKGLAIEPDDELAAHVLTLERKVRFLKLVAEAKARVSGDDWQGALEFYLKALSWGGDEDKEAVKLAIETARAEIGYRDALEKARAALEGRRWLEAMNLANTALEIMSGDEEARRIVALAEKKLESAPRITNSIGMSFVLVPAGEFLMGSLGGDPDEGPVRRVYVGSYYIGVHEVTNVQFEAFDPLRRKARTIFSPADDMPAVLVSWHDAVAFCKWLSEKEDVEYRLPTEAEWEKAARGSKGRLYPWGGAAPRGGNTWRCNIAPGRTQETWELDGYKHASPVGSYSRFASPYGLQDMSGNVWEWCFDWYRADWYLGTLKGSAGSNPTGPETGKQRVLRGGSFANNASAARGANRTAKGHGYREATIGFRCARSTKRSRQVSQVGSNE